MFKLLLKVAPMKSAVVKLRHFTCIAKPTSFWPPQKGQFIRIWSLMSKKGDGFLRVQFKEESGEESGMFRVRADGEYADTSTLFRCYKTDKPRKLSDFTSDNSEFCCIGVPGNNITDTNADPSKIYMLKWDNKGRIMAQACYPASDSSPIPTICIPEHKCPDEEAKITFLLDYHSRNDYVLLRDCQANQQRYLRTNGRGIITRETLTTCNEVQHYHDPGFLYFIQLV